MPRGRYSLYDPYDNTPLGDERFQCAAGPAGWRYTAQTTTPSQTPSGSVDLTLDLLGRPLRLEIHAAGWQVRGTRLAGLTWVRSGPAGLQAQEGNAAAHTFAGPSPGFFIAAARILRLIPGGPASRIRLVTFTTPVLAPRTRDQSWALLDTQPHDTDSGPLPVDNYQVSDLETGEQHSVHIAGDVVLSAPGVELEELDDPPSRFP